jgi:hypothetical protein
VNAELRLSFRLAERSQTPSVVELLNQTFRTPLDEATWEWYGTATGIRMGLYHSLGTLPEPESTHDFF